MTGSWPLESISVKPLLRCWPVALALAATLWTNGAFAMETQTFNFAKGEINAEWHRNPLEIEVLAISGSYMSRAAGLSDLTLGVVVRVRSEGRRARWGRMGNKAAGAHDIRTVLQALSLFVAVHFVTDAAALPRPFSIVFRDEG